jgi:hypothetical protein
LRILFGIKIRFLNIPRLWKFVQGGLGGILIWGFFLNSSRLLKDFRKIKYDMPCNASYARLYFLEGFLYARQFDMQSICTSMLAKFYSCKKRVLHPGMGEVKLSKSYIQAKFENLKKQLRLNYVGHLTGSLPVPMW